MGTLSIAFDETDEFYPSNKPCDLHWNVHDSLVSPVVVLENWAPLCKRFGAPYHGILLGSFEQMFSMHLNDLTMFTQPWYHLFAKLANCITYFGGHKCSLATRIAQYFDLTLLFTNHHTISCTEERCNHLFADSKLLKDSWSNIQYVQDKHKSSVQDKHKSSAQDKHKSSICRLFTLVPITADSLVNYLMGKIASRVSSWMAFHHHVHVLMLRCAHFFETYQIVCAVYEVRVCGFISQICATFHCTNNTIASNIQQSITAHCCLNRQKKSSAQRSLAFSLWKFDSLVWSEMFCLTFC